MFVLFLLLFFVVVVVAVVIVVVCVFCFVCFFCVCVFFFFSGGVILGWFHFPLSARGRLYLLIVTVHECFINLAWYQIIDN